MASWIYTATAHEYILHRPMQCYCIKRHTLVFTKKYARPYIINVKPGVQTYITEKDYFSFLAVAVFLAEAVVVFLAAGFLPSAFFNSA